MKTYELYKPLRNYTRQFCILESLSVIRAYFQFLQFNQPFPKDIEVGTDFLIAQKGPNKMVFEWELDVLAREIIINGREEGSSQKSLKEWKYFSKALQKIKHLENSIIGNTSNLENNIYIELHRIAHRQFPWQSPPNKALLTRYYKIFKYPPLEQLLIEAVGLNTKELFTLGLGLTGSYLKIFALTYPPNIQSLNITKEKYDHFLAHFSRSLEEIQSLLSESQKYDSDFAYSFNQLRFFPLIDVVFKGKRSHIAPIPTFLFWRLTDGVYFELCGLSKFGKFFGDSFQKYAGEVLEQSISSSQKFYPEEEYHVGKNRKDTVDWILYDDKCLLFIECKTKKLKKASKESLMDTSSLEDDLGIMADSVVQVYKQIYDFNNGRYPISFPHPIEKVFPIVLTLTEWYAFGEKIIVEILDNKINEKLNDLEEDFEGFSEAYPYTICSMNDFEIATQIMATVGVNQFMSKKVDGEHRTWTMITYIYKYYEKEIANAELMFMNDFESIYQDLILRN